MFRGHDPLAELEDLQARDEARIVEQDCPECHGYGWEAVTTADPLPSGEPGEPYQVQQACSACGGSGMIGPGR